VWGRASAVINNIGNLQNYDVTMDYRRLSDHGAAARRGGARPAPRDIRAQMQQLTLQQQRFDHSLAGQLAVDAAGLETMDYLISDGSSTPTELARHAGLSTAAMTLVLNRLEEAGHVTRAPHPSDGRKLVVTPSDRSSARARELVAPLVDGLRQAVDALTPHEREAVSTFLTAVLAVYDRAASGD